MFHVEHAAETGAQLPARRLRKAALWLGGSWEGRWGGALTGSEGEIRVDGSDMAGNLVQATASSYQLWSPRTGLVFGALVLSFVEVTPS